MKGKPDNYAEVTKQLDKVIDQLDSITTRLDMLVNLLLDIMPEDKFKNSREFNAKLERLDSIWRVKTRPMVAGRIFGRPSRDISSRRKEIATKRKKK